MERTLTEKAVTQRQLLILLAREAGYLDTACACRRLKLTRTRLLALRRRLLQKVLVVPRLPRLADKRTWTELGALNLKREEERNVP
jgi:hypothetical protein